VQQSAGSGQLMECALILVVAGLAVPAGAFVGDETVAGGSPASCASRPAVAAAPLGLDDMLMPSAEPAFAAPRSARVAQDSGAESMPPAPALAERLASWDARTRDNALLEVELPTNAPVTLLATARTAEALWDAGDYDEAIALVAQLEAAGVGVALGVGWKEPLDVGGGRDWADVRIGTRTGGSLTELDYDVDSGALFAVVRWTTDRGWALYRSTTDGASWAETYWWYAGPSAQAVDVSMAVVAGYVYVGYVASDFADELRLRRCFAATGLPDTVYSFQVPLDASPSTFTEVAVESNVDSFDNRIYCAGRQATGALRWAWAEGADGLPPFDEQSPSGVNAAGGLDMHWNFSYTTWFLMLSYVGDDGRVHVLRRAQSATSWEDLVVDNTFTGSHMRTSISAWDDVVICAYEEVYANGQGIIYRISYNAGNTWNFGDLAVPGVGEAAYQMVDVTARGGRGTAVVYTHETGEPDDVLVRYRRGFAPGLWIPAQRINDNDVATGSWTALNWTPPESAIASELSYGLVYFFGSTPYFHRFQRLPGDMNCDGVLNFGDINPFVLALSNPAAYEAVFPDCDLDNADCNGDGAVNFGDINPFVTLMTTGG